MADAGPAPLAFQLRKIGHVVLNVTDLDASVRFYTEVLGLTISDRYPDSMRPGGMVFMLSKRQYINDSAHPWHPHVMFVEPRTEDSQWGANLHGSPVVGASTNVAGTSIFMVLVARWSDGTLDPAYADPGQQGHSH